MSVDEKRAEVAAYLRLEFPGGNVIELEDSEGDVTFRIVCDKDTYNVTVQRAFIEATPLEEIPARLQEYRLAPTLRDVGEFPIVVSINGCIFA